LVADLAVRQEIELFFLYHLLNVRFVHCVLSLAEEEAVIGSFPFFIASSFVASQLSPDSSTGLYLLVAFSTIRH
jgi:hypothetical protein